MAEFEQNLRVTDDMLKSMRISKEDARSTKSSRSASPAKNPMVTMPCSDEIVLPPLPPVDYSGFQWNIPKFEEDEVIVKHVDLPAEDIVINTRANDQKQIEILKKKLTQYNKTFNITINREHDDPPKKFNDEHVTNHNQFHPASKFVRNEVQKMENYSERPIDIEYAPKPTFHQSHQNLQTYRPQPCATGRCNESATNTMVAMTTTSVSPDRYGYRTNEYRRDPETLRGSSLARAAPEARVPVEYQMTTTVKHRTDRWGVLLKSIKKSLKAKV